MTTARRFAALRSYASGRSSAEQFQLVAGQPLREALGVVLDEYVRLRVALDAITAVRREGVYNTAEECRQIAKDALARD